MSNEVIKINDVITINPEEMRAYTNYLLPTKLPITYYLLPTSN